MHRLIELALAHVPRDRPFRALVATAGDGAALIAFLDAIWAEARHAGLPDSERAAAVLARVRAADRVDRGARAVLQRWAADRGFRADGVIGFGEPLAFAQRPVQGELFGETAIGRPPSTFAQAPYDVVIADVPRRDLSRVERARLRLEFDAAAGHFTAEVPFIERLLDLAGDDGIVALRVRKAILRREFGRTLVDELGRRARLLQVDDDGEHVIAVLRVDEQGDGAMLLRTFGSESAARVLRAIQAGSDAPLGELLDGAAGSTSTPGCDEVWEPPRWLERRLPTMPLVRGTDVVNWTARPSTHVLWPYDEDGRRRVPPDPGVVAWLSRFRTLLEQREIFGRGLGERGVRWYEYLEHHPNRWGKVPAVVIARTGDQPRVAILREPAVVNASALVLRPADGVSPHFVAGVLGSSVACFWMKHLFHVYKTEQRSAFEATAVGLAQFPMPPTADRVVAAATALDRVARSIRPLRAAIDGDPQRLDARLDGAHDANIVVLDELARWQAALDDAVLDAYGLADDDEVRELIADPDVRVEFTHSSAADEHEVLLQWLADLVDDAFSTHELPIDRPVSAADVGDWLRRQPLSRAVLARAGASAAEVLRWGAVPLEPHMTFSPTGLRKLGRWADRDPQPFHYADYAAVSIPIPPLSATRHRRDVWRWRGRYNVPRERFVHLVSLSAERGQPYFAWAGADDADRQGWTQRPVDADSGQIDLERLLQIRAALGARSATTAELADELFGRGWSSADVQLALAALQRAGIVRQKGERWQLE